jgi:hypothetical protein
MTAVTKEQMLDSTYQAMAMKRREDGLRVIRDAQWNADIESAIRALIENSDNDGPGLPTRQAGGSHMRPPSSDMGEGATPSPGPSISVDEALGIIENILARIVATVENTELTNSGWSALAVLRGATKKRVSREWVEDWAAKHFDDDWYFVDCILAMLKDLGIAVEGEEQ